MRIRAVALFAVALVAVLHTSASMAQFPPVRFFGTVTINGLPAPPGTEIRAIINGIDCGARLTDVEGIYVVDAAHDGTIPRCGFDDYEVRFLINGVVANEVAIYAQGTFQEINLTVEGDVPSTPPVPQEQPLPDLPSEPIPGDAPPDAPPPDAPPPDAPPPDEPPPDEPPPDEPPAE